MQKTFLFPAAVASLLLQPAHADTRDDVWAAMRRCQIYQDDRAWLDCTYGAQQPMRARLGLPPAPEFQQRLVPPVGASPIAPQAYASLAPHGASPAEVSHRNASFGQILAGTAPPITASVLTHVRYDGLGAFIVTLENGQVWRQVDAEGMPKARFKIGARVTVTQGAMWSYNMKTDDGAHVYKVQRKN